MKTSRRPTRWIGVVVFGLLVSLSTTGCRRGLDGPGEEPALATVAWSELGPYRPSILRLSPPLKHGPCAAAIDPLTPSSALGFERDATRFPVLACAPAKRPEGLVADRLLAFHTRLHRESEIWPEDSRLHARGLLSLLTPSQDGALTQAEIRLAEARRLDPDNAATINDLAVATLLQAAEGDRPDRAIEGFVLLEDALRRNPRSIPALFNRAVVLSLFELRTPARSAWRAFLKEDRASPWSTEAKEWLQYLDRPTYEQEWRSKVEPALRDRFDQGDDLGLADLVARHRQRSREWAERELMQRWVTEILDQRSGEAARLLELMGRVGAALGTTSGDRMLSREVTRMRTASPRDLERSAAGHLALAKGYDALYDSWRLDDATRELTTARRELELQDSPFAFWATFYLALVDYYGKEYETSLRALEDLERRLAGEPYPVLQGRVFWVQGLIHIARQRLQAALDCYQAGLERFQGAGEEQNTAVLHSLVAEAWSKLGDRRGGWHHGFAALRGTPRIFMPVRHHAVLEALIMNARREQGLEPFALAMSQEHVRVAEATGGDEILHNAQMRLGATLQALGREEEALEAYRRAESAAARLDDPRFAARARADRALLRAEAMTDSDPAGAKRLLDQAIETYEATGFVYLLPRALDARARAHLEVGNHGSAEKDLEREIELYEATAGDLLEDPLRMSYLGQAHAGFQRMVAFQATTLGRPVKALHYAERGRVRALLNLYTLARLDGLIPAEARPELAPVTAPGTLLPRLPPATAVLEYVTLEDRVLLWVLRREGIESFELSGGQPLASKIEALHRSIAREKPGVPRPSEALYELLIRPGLDALAGARRLVVVADDRLAGVPFEALFDARTKRFLVEDFEVSYAPSATLYAQLLEERARRGGSGRVQRVLAVSGVGGTRFGPLPNAEGEALAVAGMYPGSTLLRGDRVSEEELLERIGEADVLHFAGHAIPNPNQELASKLILEDSPKALRELHAYELYGHRFERTSLVVLSACDTGRIHGHPGESVAILARPFLASGVPTVVGSLWQVDDRATRSFFELFHRRLADGEDAVTALALTKRRLLRSGGPRPIPPRTWAAFVAIGAP